MTNFSNKKPGRQGEWIITLTRKNADDETEVVGNGLYWLVQDNSGGWTRLLTKMTANRITMDGARCPKSDAAVHDSLKDSRDTLVLKGHQVGLPNKGITYTKLIQELIAFGAIPDPNTVDGNNAIPPAVVPAPANAAEAYSQEVDQIIHLDNGVQEAAQAPVGGPDTQEFSQDVSKPRYTEADFNVIVQRNNMLEDYARDLEVKNRELHENALKYEEKLSAGVVDTSEKMATSVRAVLDKGLTEMASAMEFRLNREMGHIGKEVKGLIREGVVPTMDDISQQMCGLTTTVNALSEQMTEVVLKVERQEQQQQKNIHTLGQLGVNVGEILQVTKAMNELGRNTAPNFVTPPNKTAAAILRPTPPPQKCTFCHGSGHTFTYCRVRPEGHMCIRCRSPRHRDDDCPTISLACTVCKQMGHGSVLHATADPAERMRILQFFGPNSLAWFKEFLNTPGASKKLKY